MDCCWEERKKMFYSRIGTSKQSTVWKKNWTIGGFFSFFIEIHFPAKQIFHTHRRKKIHFEKRKQSMKFRFVRMTKQASTAQIVFGALRPCVCVCDVMMLVCVYVLYYRRQHQNGACAAATPPTVRHLPKLQNANAGIMYLFRCNEQRAQSFSIFQWWWREDGGGGVGDSTLYRRSARNMHITIYLFKSQHNAPLIHFIESRRPCRLIISN